jgi:carbamoyl-phosphate synthase large subunit
MKKPDCIGISGINATDNPGPGVAVAKSLAESSKKLTLIGLSYDAHDPGHYLVDLFKNSFLLPFPSKGWKHLEAGLKEVQSKSGLNILVPCLDAELPILIRHQSELNKMGLQTFLPTERQFELRSKARLVDLAKELHCYYPKTSVVHTLDELAKQLNESFSLPALVKGNYYKAYTVFSIDNAVLKGAEIAAEWGFPLLAQERVSGQEINLIGLGDGKGGLLGRVTIKKQMTTQLGKVWTAVTIHDELINQLSHRFCEITQWRGPFELECIRNSSGLYLIEINPRFPAWVYFATSVGINLPQMLIELIKTGKCKPSLQYPAGKFLVRQTSEFVTDLIYFQNLLSTRNREGL